MRASLRRSGEFLESFREEHEGNLRKTTGDNPGRSAEEKKETITDGVLEERGNNSESSAGTLRRMFPGMS